MGKENFCDVFFEENNFFEIESDSSLVLDDGIDLVDMYFNEIKKYPLLTKEQEVEIGKKLLYKNDISILSFLVGENEGVMIDLEKVFSSITDYETKEFVLGGLKNYYQNSGKSSSTTTNIINYYLDEYEKLCDISLNKVPSIEELNAYFKNKKYENFVNFSEDKRLDNDELSLQVYMFLQYMMARDVMFNSNLRLVVSVAKNMYNSKFEFMDSISVGNLGLMRAIDSFNVELGFRFSTYATQWIYQFISRERLNNGSTIRISTNLYGLKFRINKVVKDFVMKNGYEPSDEKIVELLGDVTFEEVLNVKKIFYLCDVCSLDVPVSDDKDDSILCLISDSERDDIGDLINDIDTHNMIERIFEYFYSKDENNAFSNGSKRMSYKEKLEIIKYRYGFYSSDESLKTLEQTAKKFGLSRERIRRIEFDTIREMKVVAGKLIK